MTTTSDPKPDTDHRSSEAEDSAVVGGGADDSEDREESDESADDGDLDDDDDLDDDEDLDDSNDSDPRRAAFLDDLPDAAELRPLVESYAAGNYARLRQQEQALQDQSKDPEILAAARELVERTEPDPLSKTLLWLSILFFLFVVGWVYLHHGQY